jgi:hypothetical protein
VMRVVTLLWVCLSNLGFAWLVLSRLLDERALYRLLGSQVPWDHYAPRVAIIVILLVGVILELANSRAAFFVNVGFFLMITGYAAYVVAYGWQESEARNLGLLLGEPALLVLIIDMLLYAAKKRLRRVEPLA